MIKWIIFLEFQESALQKKVFVTGILKITAEKRMIYLLIPLGII